MEFWKDRRITAVPLTADCVSVFQEHEFEFLPAAPPAVAGGLLGRGQPRGGAEAHKAHKATGQHCMSAPARRAAAVKVQGRALKRAAGVQAHGRAAQKAKTETTAEDSTETAAAGGAAAGSVPTRRRTSHPVSPTASPAVPSKRTKPEAAQPAQLTVLVRGLIYPSDAEAPVEHAETDSEDSNDPDYRSEEDDDCDDPAEFLDDADPEDDISLCCTGPYESYVRSGQQLVWREEEDRRCSERCWSYMEPAYGRVSAVHGDIFRGPLPWRGFATDAQMHCFLNEALADNAATHVDDPAAELRLQLFGFTHFTDHRGTEPYQSGRRVATGWEGGQQHPFTLDIVHSSFLSLLDSLLDFVLAVTPGHVRTQKPPPAHKLQTDGFSRRVTQGDARKAIDMWWGSQIFFEFFGVGCPCPRAGICRCQIKPLFDDEANELVLKLHRRSNNCYRRLAWAKICHGRLATDSAGSCLTFDLLEQVANSQGAGSECMSATSWLPDSTEQSQPRLAPPHPVFQQRQDWQELFAARGSVDDWSTQEKLLVFDQASFAVLVWALCRRNPMRRRYRLQPEALFMLQCAIEAAISLKLRTTWPWPQKRLEQDWESIDLVSLRKLAAQCPGLSGDSGIETWTQGELAVRLRAY
jgi:hypothetical protein